ncbi:protein phosphatase 1 regulatory subunit 35 isoform X1 [Python bivittatus]|uniref:Protein phosphatase 1 regulatory subunit 35 isoform X1 n=1 Tax=Python bivittatus TaxID=176946 RepID=A0A9F5J194_PYTBI|nr:protein phosphatase 1 regulatory subunit 35 isoform X1 [Python bivittatus]
MVRKEPRGSPAALHALGTPAPHSSLALGAEVQATREQAFDARQAAEELVQHSFVARCAVGAHVGEGLNIPRDQQLYQGLISLQVPADELINSAVQEKLALAQYHPGGRKARGAVHRDPRPGGGGAATPEASGTEARSSHHVPYVPEAAAVGELRKDRDHTPGPPAGPLSRDTDLSHLAGGHSLRSIAQPPPDTLYINYNCHWIAWFFTLLPKGFTSKYTSDMFLAAKDLFWQFFFNASTALCPSREHEPTLQEQVALYYPSPFPPEIGTAAGNNL